MLRRRAGGLAPLEGDEELETNRDEETSRDDQEEGGETSREAEEGENEEPHRDETNAQETDRGVGEDEINREEEDYQSMLFDSHTAEDEEVSLLREMDEHFGGEDDQNELVIDYNTESMRENNETGDE